ncbi:MAG: hypothetical protein KIT62_02420 [Cyclobacteriaceae bacterium]|nr:hypothetical protein [Cyclobacteriaceae bacterium]
MPLFIKSLFTGFLLVLLINAQSIAQELYTARGFWQETKKETYRKIADRKLKGDSLTVAEAAYLEDYEKYLTAYYERLPEEEKRKYQQQKAQWDLEQHTPAQQTYTPDFELRTRDRLINGVYGAYYGISIVAGTEATGPAAAGIIPITAGLWQLGPVINKKKYEGINASTIRAGNSGRFLGLFNGAFLGIAIAGDNDAAGNTALIFSSAGSIALGEIAFQTQKRRNFSEGHIEIMRHYGFLGPFVSGMVLASGETSDNHAIGAGLLAGGIGGLVIGHNVAQKYDYTQGDVDVISTLSLISAGLGFAVAAEGIDGDGGPGLFLLPAVTAISGTLLGQKSVKGIHITKSQGNIISFAAGGAALVGIGLMVVAEAESGLLVIGVPSLFALAAHRAMFSSYKKQNLAEIKLGQSASKRVRFSMQVAPENYFTNKRAGEKIVQTGHLSNPIVKLRLKF